MHPASRPPPTLTERHDVRVFQASASQASASQASAPPLLSGGALRVAHTLWSVVVALDALVFIPGVLLFDRVSHLPCTVRNQSSCTLSQLPPAGMRALTQSGISLDLYAALAVVVVTGISAIFIALGAVIARRKWREGLGLLVSALLITFGANGVAGAFQGADAQLPPAIRPAVAALLGSGVGGALFVLQWPALGTFLLTFPTGRFASRWSWVLVGLWITNFFAFVLSPPPPVTIASIVLTYGSVLALQVYRYRRVYGSIERQQTKWLVYALGVAVGFELVYPAVLALFATAGSASGTPSASSASSTTYGLVVYPLLFALGGAVIFLVLALAVAIALLRYHLYDIDLILHRTLVYGALTVCVVGLYVLIVGYLGAALRVGSNPVTSLLATGVVAVLFQPLRERLQRGVNRLMFGERDNPNGVLARLDTRLALAIPTETVLPTIVETVATALKLPYAAIALAGREPTDGTGAPGAPGAPPPTGAGASAAPARASNQAPGALLGERVAAAYGTPPAAVSSAAPLRLPLTYGAETVGWLQVAARPGENGLAPADKRLLDDLATHAGVVVHAVRLTADLQRTRERLVTAREEERRRLRRDLHDGLGPQLASLTLTLTAAREYLSRDPAAADALLRELAKHVQSAMGDVRRLVYALRPPALDDLGLVGALQSQAARYSLAGLAVRIDVCSPLPLLPAAVEVAAYRVCLEALTNVVRHARAHCCVIRLRVEYAPSRQLTAEVVDDGIGIAPGVAAGVGLRSMRERAEELGGQCEIERLPQGGGTRVRARWPVLEA